MLVHRQCAYMANWWLGNLTCACRTAWIIGATAGTPVSSDITVCCTFQIRKSIGRLGHLTHCSIERFPRILGKVSDQDCREAARRKQRSAADCSQDRGEVIELRQRQLPALSANCPKVSTHIPRPKINFVINEHFQKGKAKADISRQG